MTFSTLHLYGLSSIGATTAARMTLDIQNNQVSKQELLLP
jgi:hypothetical protein